jgi:FkbM family methyltransferase
MSTPLADAPLLAPSAPALPAPPALFRVLLRLAWPLTKPLRWYWVNSKRKLGKKLLVDRALKHFLPSAPAGFYAELPHGGRVFLHYREDIGLAVLMSGGFEPGDIEFAVEHARPDSVAFDVGANVGMFTIPLAHAVGAAGRVVAVEPSPDNAQRLEENVRCNGLANVQVEAVAVVEQPGPVTLHLGNDPAFHSTSDVDDYRDADSSMVVPGTTLDDLWESCGEPDVSFVKVDTEGGELSVLRGAPKLLSTGRPVILVEAKGDARVRELDRWLGRFDYVRTSASRLSPGNFVYSRS